MTHAGEVDVAAELVALVEERDRKTALGERHGGLESGGAGADYRHGQAVAVHVQLARDAELAAAAGVHGAAGLIRAELGLGQAVHAGDAELQLVLAAFGDLVAELGLGEELTAQRDEVALAGFDDGVDVIRVPQGAAGGHGDGDALFHDLGEGHLPALLLVAVGAHAGQAGDDAAAVDG